MVNLPPGTPGVTTGVWGGTGVCLSNHVHSFTRLNDDSDGKILMENLLSSYVADMPPNTFNNVDNNMKAKLISNVSIRPSTGTNTYIIQ